MSSEVREEASVRVSESERGSVWRSERARERDRESVCERCWLQWRATVVIALVQESRATPLFPNPFPSPSGPLSTGDLHHQAD